MTGDLVYREDVLSALKGVIARTGVYGVSIEVILANIPAVEAEPVVHARWERVLIDGCLGRWRCSACEKWQVKKSKRCPECGAHMDEG